MTYKQTLGKQLICKSGDPKVRTKEEGAQDETKEPVMTHLLYFVNYKS